MQNLKLFYWELVKILNFSIWKKLEYWHYSFSAFFAVESFDLTDEYDYDNAT